MTVEVQIHLERVDDGAVWWAESSDVDGFYAADDHLPALLDRVERALGELVGAELPRDEPLKVAWQLVAEDAGEPASPSRVVSTPPVTPLVAG